MPDFTHPRNGLPGRYSHEGQKPTFSCEGSITLSEGQFTTNFKYHKLNGGKQQYDDLPIQVTQCVLNVILIPRFKCFWTEGWLKTLLMGPIWEAVRLCESMSLYGRERKPYVHTFISQRLYFIWGQWPHWILACSLSILGRISEGILSWRLLASPVQYVSAVLTSHIRQILSGLSYPVPHDAQIADQLTICCYQLH